MSIVHIFKSTNKKFYEPYIEFINTNFNINNHFFIIEKYGKNSKKNLNKINVEYISLFQYFRLIKGLYTSEKIILHALMSPRLVLILFFQPWLLKKCYWVIWGSDLYYYVTRKKNVNSSITEFLRKNIIKNMRGLITHIKGDYELAKQWYGAKGNYYYSFMYPSNLWKEKALNETMDHNGQVTIQIGNSADPSNMHIEVFEKLQIYRNEDIRIICPLSYGNKEYAREVEKQGRAIFGNKFLSLSEFVAFEKYIELLSGIDIAIFNHRRQQGLGNITTLLGLGKKVYIREEITTWKFCKEHNLKVYSANGDFSNLFEMMDKTTRFNNIESVKRQFSEDKLKEDWREIFDA